MVLKFSSIFFSDTTWFYGLHDFTVTLLRYINYYTIQYYTNSIQYNTIPTVHTPYNIFTLIIYIVILPMTCQCRSRNCFASIPRKIVTHRPCGFLFRICQICWLDTRILFLFCVMTIEKWDCHKVMQKYFEKVSWHLHHTKQYNVWDFSTRTPTCLQPPPCQN